jgi:hypothetical protein
MGNLNVQPLAWASVLSPDPLIPRSADGCTWSARRSVGGLRRGLRCQPTNQLDCQGVGRLLGHPAHAATRYGRQDSPFGPLAAKAAVPGLSPAGLGTRASLGKAEPERSRSVYCLASLLAGAGMSERAIRLDIGG